MSCQSVDQWNREKEESSSASMAMKQSKDDAFNEVEDVLLSTGAKWFPHNNNYVQRLNN